MAGVVLAGLSLVSLLLGLIILSPYISVKETEEEQLQEGAVGSDAPKSGETVTVTVK